MVHSVAVISGPPPYSTHSPKKAGAIDSGDRKFRCLGTESVLKAKKNETVAITTASLV
jgi:hypothetical protein